MGIPVEPPPPVEPGTDTCFIDDLLPDHCEVVIEGVVKGAGWVPAAGDLLNTTVRLIRIETDEYYGTSLQREFRLIFSPQVSSFTATTTNGILYFVGQETGACVEYFTNALAVFPGAFFHSGTVTISFPNDTINQVGYSGEDNRLLVAADQKTFFEPGIGTPDYIPQRFARLKDGTRIYIRRET